MFTIEQHKPINIYFPSVYRYLESKYVDLFFNEGILRIKSLRAFVNHPSDARRDSNEGSGTTVARFTPTSQFFQMGPNIGNNEYVLCTSLLKSDSLTAKYQTNSLFEILDPLNFAAAMMNSIAGSQNAYLGNCKYQQFRIVEHVPPGTSIDNLRDDEGKLVIGGEKWNALTSGLQAKLPDILFLKEMAFQEECEFRFAWSLHPSIEIGEHLDVFCKEAVQFCKRVDSV